MYPIITFLQIIVIFVFLFLIISKERKNNIILIAISFIFLVASGIIYYFPIYTINLEEGARSAIEFNDFDFNIDTYVMTPSDNERLVNILEDTKIRRVGNSNSYSNESYNFEFYAIENYMTFCSVRIDKRNGQGYFYNNEKDKRYLFQASDELLDFVQAMDEKYRKASHLNDEACLVDLKKIDTDTNYERYDTTISCKSNFRIDEVYLYTKKALDSQGKSFANKADSIDEEGYHYNLLYLKPENGYVDLYIRGEYLLDTEMRLFQRIIRMPE